MVISAALRKTPFSTYTDNYSPSAPVTPMASTRFWVSRNGTRSGTAKVSAYQLSPRMTHSSKQAIEIDMDRVTGQSVKEYVFAMSVAESTLAGPLSTHPRTCPIIDITASVRQ